MVSVSDEVAPLGKDEGPLWCHRGVLVCYRDRASCQSLSYVAGCGESLGVEVLGEGRVYPILGSLFFSRWVSFFRRTLGCREVAH